MAQSRTIDIKEQILKANDELACQIRQRLDTAGVLAINLMASPGGGKTSLMLKTIEGLIEEFRISAIVGDPVMIDVDKIAAMGIPVELVNSGGSCHLDAQMLLEVLPKIDLGMTDLLMIENVGNLICPANFALGAHINVVIASVPEGADKPYKYPVMYRGADVLLLNKMDTIDLFDFDVDYFRAGIKVLNNEVSFFPISCRTGEGLDAWFDWLRAQTRQQHEFKRTALQIQPPYNEFRLNSAN